MAEDEDIIIFEEDENKEQTSQTEELKEIEEEEKEDEKKNNTNLILISSIVFLSLLIVIAVATIIVYKSGSHEPQVTDINTTSIATKLNKKTDLNQFSPSHLENMIKKANVLHESGNKEEALKVYEQISEFNEAISYYNIGVANMKEKNYKEALNSFKKAINNEEQRCVSAINAAVSAMKLGNNQLFKYYIDLAYIYLPMESDSPLYSYYVGLVNYYKNYYYESLAALTNLSSEYYNYEQNYLSSKIFASMDLNNRAVSILEKESKIDDSFTLGLLYARLGEFEIAKKYLLKADGNTQKPLHLQAALALVYNKLGELDNSAAIMNKLYVPNDDNATKIYPIKTVLKKSLFDVNLAQSNFDKTLFFDDKKTYALLFYFAPFKIFNTQQTVDYIRKGSMNIFADEIGPALSFLKKSSAISKVNISMSKGIKKAFNHHTEQANQIFLKTVDTYPKHSVLHYNLALTYAQMSDFTKAHEHFKKSYNLNNNNYLAGAFAIMTGELIKVDIVKLKENVIQSMASDSKLENNNLFIALIQLTQNNQLSLIRWLEQEKKKTPLNLILDTIIAKKTLNETAYRQKANMLKLILPKDIMVNIINFNVKNNKNNIKKYAQAIQMDFKNLELDYESFYYGPRIVQESYVKLLQIGGLLHYERDALIKKMQLEKKDIAAIMQTLAYISIYTHNFEEAYVLYNQLIDDLGKSDSETIFLAAVASIGANHIENAIALLELAKLTDPRNYESRYALGLLYQEIRNWKGATIQYNQIGNSGFKSEYFSFEITR
ncbi:MAG: hypothetical protein JJV95_04580 [Sulfurospirillum sp.]|nr:hypothetical protein [Sulfurospirillum sp.]MBL0703239.1 hypothetical protein [Sulfurospirillum sp.]